MLFGIAVLFVTLSAGKSLAVVLPAPPTIDWDKAVPLRIDAGRETPLVLFGFNPQPEPPPLGYSGPVLSFPGNAARLTGTGASNPQAFSVVFGFSSAAGPTIVAPADPDTDFGSLLFAIDTGLQTLDLVLEFGTSSGGIGSGIDAVSFNPQPEPPPSLFGDYETYGLLFSFTSLSDAYVTMRVIDAGGDELRVSGVPLPAGGALLAAAVVGIGLLRRTHRQRGRVG